ncbi:hypothetical protein B0J13DRAFT_559211 [Dactylonectria estremocensis]|uniref:Uncharacterized protein n=1 Tax=Dactylonectria estremocensis TaxID=1079267 RepID=A0A9P9ED60_9HYPO|nr:hypothetical protein B0J13DRAFT_559211 [Dactylonectria estremocensis]
MPNQSDVLEKFQSTLEPFIKPREQVNYIRRVLALHLGSCSHGGPLKQPVSLVNSSHDVAVGKELKGVQREYIEALRANVAARRQYADVAQANPPRPSSPKETQPSSLDFVEDRIALLKLQGKRERLCAVQKYLDLLIQKPAGSVEFLDPEDMFHSAGELPNVPREVVNSLVAQQTTTKPDLKGQVAQLEKTVLRAKLLLRREEQLLRDARSGAHGIPDVISNGARLDALNATRNELITWIETELGKASGEEVDGGLDGVSKNQDKLAADSAAITSQLKDIKEKYARYLAARRSLLSTMTERPGASRPPGLKAPDTTKQRNIEAEPTPSNYLLTPYIETLLSLSRNQRSTITQKSYINTTLNNEVKEACQVFSHLAEESQLLPLHPTSESSRRRSGLGEILTSTDRAGFAGRVQPWVLAADSAKIATLEIVAEKVEGGQVALENSMKAIREINILLGQSEVDEPETAKEEPTEDDIWLDTGAKNTTGTRKHTGKAKGAEKGPKDAWSILHGNLGLIGQEEAA